MADPKVRLARAIVGFCKDLEQGNGEVARLWRSAEQALGQQQADNGLKTAVESLGQYTHKKASELTTSGASMTKAAIHMAEVVSKEAVKTARDDNNKVLEALALGVQADVLILASETTKAIKVANAAASLFRRLDDKSGEAAVLGSITTAYLVKANAGFNPQLEMADKADEKIEQIRQKRETETDLALEAAKEIVTLHRALGDRKSEAQALDKVAEIHLMKEEPDQCKAVAREERSLYQELNDVHGEAAALQTIINANLQNVDDYDDALIAAKDMVKLFRGRVQNPSQCRPSPAHITQHLALAGERAALPLPASRPAYVQPGLGSTLELSAARAVNTGPASRLFSLQKCSRTR